MRAGTALPLVLAAPLGCAEPASSDAGGAAARSAPPVVRFAERVDGSGIDFVDTHGRDGADKVHLLESMGGGVGLIDFDADGDDDLFFANGDRHDGSEPGASRLYRNDGRFAFADATAGAGIDLRRDATGVAVGDVDDDGADDLFVAVHGRNVLYRNRGDGRFEDVSSAAGVEDELYASSAAFADLDGDGDLDLFVCNYYLWDDAAIELSRKGGTFRREAVLAGPQGFRGAPDVLYRNGASESGELRFEDATEEAGLAGSRSFALGVVAADHDDDGDVDLYVANDSEANSLFVNDGAMVFDDRGIASGTAFDRAGGAQAGMGVDFGDVDLDGSGDFFATNFSHDYNTLYRGVGRGLFEDATSRFGLVGPSFLTLGFGCAFLDVDLDGDQDLAVANGHVFPNIGDVPLNTSYAQPDQLFVNEGGTRFRLVESPWGSARQPTVSRGLARGDLDGDGREDLVVTNLNGRPSLLRNETDAGAAAVLRLHGTASNPDAVGARVVVEAVGEPPRVRRIVGGGSYLSASSRDVVIGLGDAGACDVTVHWPAGGEPARLEVRAGTRVTLREGQAGARVEPLEAR